MTTKAEHIDTLARTLYGEAKPHDIQDATAIACVVMNRVALPNYAGLMAVNRRTMAVCRKVQAICVDLASEVFFSDGDHYDGLHTTPRGSEKIGRYLFGKLRRLGT